MDIRDIEQITDPADFAWRRYIEDTPDYEDLDLYIPVSRITEEQRTVEYRLGNHARFKTTRVFRKVLDRRDWIVALMPAPRTPQVEFDFESQREAADAAWYANLPTLKLAARFRLEHDMRARWLWCVPVLYLIPATIEALI